MPAASPRPSPDDLSRLSAGDRVALLLPSSAEYAEAVLALLVAGLRPVPLDPAMTAAERTAVLQDVRPAVVVDDPRDLPALRALGPADLTGTLPRSRPLHLTSGTTGRRKAVDSGLLADVHARALVAEERDLWGFAADDVHLVISPLYHSAPLRFAHGTLLAGGRIVVPGAFDPATVTRVIETERPTSVFCVPTHLQRLLAHWDTVGVPDLTSFRLLAHAGAPCPPGVKRRVVQLFPEGSTWEFYGSTEGQFTACRSEEWLARPGTVGRARPGRRLFTDEDDHLWCVVPPHARFTYLDAPEKTRQAWRETPDGPAFSVGDVGRIDADGYVHLDGRRSDLVITGGVNVYPLEVENALRECPGVEDVAVFARPDQDWGQRVCAAVVGDVEEPVLRDWARTHLSPAKRPKQYEFRAELPRNPTGKVLRDRLADGT